MYLLIPLVSAFTGCAFGSQEFTITKIESINGTYSLSHEKAKDGEDITITTIACALVLGIVTNILLNKIKKKAE